MSSSTLKLIALGLAIIVIAGTSMVLAKPDLAKIHDDIEADYERVAHINSDTFSKLPGEDVIIFDVREPEEFAVSHLPGAIQVDPGISEAEFQSRYGSAMEGKTAVFYCSVGRRSSHLAERVATVVETQTSKAPANLIGGVFQWSNENRSLMSTAGAATNAIHPYNAHWGRLIHNREAIQYSTPAPTSGEDHD